MDEKLIYDFIDRFEKSSLSMMKIEKDNLLLHLEKPVAAVNAAPAAMPQGAPLVQAQTSEENIKVISDSYEKVKAPIVGVFYEAPSPDEEPFVKIGDEVKAGQVLCLVEAMKMMNELKSPVNGIIKNIYARNGELVEFDQVLFEVEPC